MHVALVASHGSAGPDRRTVSKPAASSRPSAGQALFVLRYFNIKGNGDV